jgi:hypothetical protein
MVGNTQFNNYAGTYGLKIDLYVPFLSLSVRVYSAASV